MNSATLFTGYWMAFNMAGICGISDFANLSVLYGTGVNLGLWLLVTHEVVGLGTNHLVNLGCLLLFIANCLVIKLTTVHKNGLT